MAPYLATVSVGRFDTSGSDFSNPDRPLYVYVDSSFTRAADRIIPRQQQVPAILDWYAGYYGVPYPFRAAGGIVPRVSSSLGYVLETQTKPTYPSSSASSTGTGITTIAHENAHQWFGNMVTLSQWKDIWLNEGITEFSTWLWDSTVNAGTDSMPVRFSDIYDNSPDGFWAIAPAAPPTAADIFDSDAMYDRGATTMTAIREIFIADGRLGEPAFRAMMRSWLVDHAYGNVTTEEFIALVKRTDPDHADRWDAFFREWLYTSYEGTRRSPATSRRSRLRTSSHRRQPAQSSSQATVKVVWEASPGASCETAPAATASSVLRPGIVENSTAKVSPSPQNGKSSAAPNSSHSSA